MKRSSHCHPGLQTLFAVLLFAATVALGHRAAAADAPDPDDTRLPSAPLHEEVLSLAGDPGRPVTLQVTLFTPAGPGPFPLAVVNHGATNASASNRGDRNHFTIAAYYFLSRGYAVALPMMRGFAGSGGSMMTAGCDLAAVAQANARDIHAVIDALSARPGIDGTRIVAAGQSFGGWNTLGLGAAPPPGVRGLVAFNAALRTSDCPAGSQDGSMAAAAGQLGARTALPSLLFYGENDSIMPVAAWRALAGSYARAAAGRSELVDFGTYGSDSHQVLSFPGSLPLWAPRLDAFLARIGMPSAPAYPAYLPHPVPPATRFAALQDVAAVPLNDQGRALYQHFLNAPQPRAFVIGPGGTASHASGGYDPLGFALRACGRLAQGCQPYAVNSDVVWTGPKLGEQAAAPTRLVDKAVRMNASTSLGAFFAVNANCSSRGLPRVSIAALPAHGTAVVGPREEHPAFPPSHPYATCNATPIPAMGVTYTPAPGLGVR